MTDELTTRIDKISKTGNVSLRTGGRLHHIGIGRTYAGMGCPEASGQSVH